MQCKIYGEIINQVAFVDYNPWENVYNSNESQISKPCSDLWRRMFVCGMAKLTRVMLIL